MDTYKIRRFYLRVQSSGYYAKTLQTGLTLEQAQEHCKNPESSSSTATGSKAKAVTRRCGPWFDGYTKE